ncbi:MAG: hypothetical protein ACRC37_06010 [Lentisphaeria bacterium]
MHTKNKISTLLVLLALTLTGCQSTQTCEINDVRETLQVLQLQAKYSKFLKLEQFIDNSVAMYNCTYRVLASGKLTDLKIEKIYSTEEVDYCNDLMNFLNGEVAYLDKPAGGRVVSQSMIFCYQKERWPLRNTHVPIRLDVFEGKVNYRFELSEPVNVFTASVQKYIQKINGEK